MASRAAASPAWLGLFAAASFGGLVLAAFASGYHLVGRAAARGAATAPSGTLSEGAERTPSEPEQPRAEPAPAPAASPAASNVAKTAAAAEAASPGAASTAAVSPGRAAAPRRARAAAGTETATVRQHLPAARTVLRSKPDGHDHVAVLLGKQQVTVLARQGHWCRIEYRRFGKTITGWTDESNLAFP